MTTKLTDYKGFEIHVKEDGTFLAYEVEEVDGNRTIHEVASAPSMSDIRGEIDTISKKKFKIPCFIATYSSTSPFTAGVITSTKQSRYGSGHTFRVSYENSYRGQSWSEYRAQDIVKDTPENRKLIKEHEAIQKDVVALTKKKDAIFTAMERYTEKELLA